MTSMSLRCWFCCTLVLLAGCGALQHRQLKDALKQAQTPRLTRAGSTEALDRSLQAAEAFEDLRTQAHCANPTNRKSYRCDDDEGLDRIVVTGSRIDPSDVITNNQELGVDEGDIVKKLGSRLFVLRRGRLYSISLGQPHAPGLTLVDTVAVGRDEKNDPVWYDEILTFGESLVLLGFNWRETIAELVVFDITPQGRLSRRAHFGLRSDDYYRVSNYGARIQGEHLLLSLSTSLLASNRTRWPEWSRRDVPSPTWWPLVEADDVFLPLTASSEPTVHLVVRCPLNRLSDLDLNCISTGIVGSDHSEFYASSRAAYLAIAEWDREALLDPRLDEDNALWDDHLAALRAQRHIELYRIPFDAEQQPAVARVEGTMGNQFSFKENGTGIFVAAHDADENGDAVLLQHVGWQQFGPDLSQSASELARIATRPAHQTFRFSPHALWIGTAAWAKEDGAPLPPLLRQPLNGAPAQAIALPHSSERIELVGDRLIASGVDSDERWQVSLLADEQTGTALSTLAIPDYFNSDARSHAFNAARLPSLGWIFGTPVLPSDWEDDYEAVSDLLLFRIGGDTLQRAAVLTMGEPNTAPDCDDCVDWYGNARLFFVGARIFALSADQLIEAEATSGGVREVRRVRLRSDP